MMCFCQSEVEDSFLRSVREGKLNFVLEHLDYAGVDVSTRNAVRIPDWCLLFYNSTDQQEAQLPLRKQDISAFKANEERRRGKKTSWAVARPKIFFLDFLARTQHL